MIYRLDHPHEGDLAAVVQRVGGKGASLWAMTTRLGLPTPPGFTIGCDYSETFDEAGLTDELVTRIDKELAWLGERLGRRYGDPEAPLLLSVRSGAPVSMPGMMETILNVGLTPEAVSGLARYTGSEAFALDSWQRFLSMYANSVLDAQPPETHASPSDPAALHAAALELEAFVTGQIGEQALADPRGLLLESIRAVFRSRHSAPARAYRRREGLPEDMGTAVTVQAMVFGNLDERSGTGVVFSRDPSTGERALTGDWMQQAQGEDVVAGVKATRPIDELAEAMPEVHRELASVSDALEHFYQDMVDIEFTVERGKLWVLQARVGKRSAAAAVRIAVELAEDPGFSITRDEAVARIPSGILSGERPLARGATGGERIATGLPASPGTASGRVVMTPEDAVETGEDADVILVRRETSPSDVHGMSAAKGVLTSLGGLMSHAAVVARDWGLPAVVGAEDLQIDAGGFEVDGHRVDAGDIISIDGSSGHVYLGEVGTRAGTDPNLATLREWAQDGMKDRQTGTEA